MGMPAGEQFMCANGGHTSDEPFSLRFCQWKGYKHAKSYKTGGHSGPCALFKVEANGAIAGRRWDGGHGTRMSEITCSGVKQKGCSAVGGLQSGVIAVYAYPKRPDGSTATFKCKTGFVPSPANTKMTCNNGKWTGSSPTKCILDPNPKVFSNPK